MVKPVEWLAEHFRRNAEQHAGAAAATGTVLSLQGFSLGSVLQGIAVGVGVFLFTTGIKWLYRLITGSPPRGAEKEKGGR
jgi:hypothetical protein